VPNGGQSPHREDRARLIGRGELEAYKIRKVWRVRRDHLERRIEARRVGTQPAATGGLWGPDNAT
jgi:hypothetical protein